jgi:uncharacterized protein (TIGR02588 family)
MRQNAVEWVVLALSVAVIVVLVAALVVDAVADEGAPPRPTIVVHEADARATEVGWLLPATIGNDGDQAAEQVTVEAAAEVDGVQQTSQAEVDFLPSGASTEVAFGFTDRPDGEVTVRVIGYRLP